MAAADGTNKSFFAIARSALVDYRKRLALMPPDEAASHIYTLFDNGASKAIAAQHLAAILEHAVRRGRFDAASLREKLPPYLVAAIEHVTQPVKP